MTARRNRQVIRQWQLLRNIEDSPTSLGQLALDLDVTTRTVRRDLDALQEAGFPLYDERGDDDTKRWRLATKGITPARIAA